jgi:hypothetical protein
MYFIPAAVMFILPCYSGQQVHRFFSGKLKSVQQTRKEQKRLQRKFNRVFVVTFENKELVLVETASEKM